MSKRRRFILTSILLSLGFIAVQVFPQQYRFLSIGSLGVLTLILFSWSLREGLSYNMTLLALILPILFTVAVGLFWFLLPSSIFARIPVVALYGFGVYALCLTVNIYTVAAVRTIALMRAARGVGFVLTLLTFFLIFDTILSLKWPLYFLIPARALGVVKLKCCSDHSSIPMLSIKSYILDNSLKLSFLITVFIFMFEGVFLRISASLFIPTMSFLYNSTDLALGNSLK